MPVFYDLISRYPTPLCLSTANQPDIVSIFRPLGLQNQRARKCIALAKTWLESPPTKGKRWKRLNYPNPADGRDIKPDELPLPDDDPRPAWEVAQLTGIGAYAIDSWRIFCRDALRGLPTGVPTLAELENEDTRREEMEKEWTRVLPLDKELRAYLRWRWLRCGIEWDPVGGGRKVADERVVRGAREGGVMCEGEGGGGEVGSGQGEVVVGGEI